MTNRTENSELVRSLIEQLGVSQRKAAAMLDVNERTMRGWCADKPPAPLTVIFALHYLCNQKALPKGMHNPSC